MADRKGRTALKALDLLQNIQEDDSDAETDIQSCEDVYDSHEDNFDELESEFSSDNESLVSESSNSDISDFLITILIQKRMKIRIFRITQQALQLLMGLLRIFWTLFKIIPDGNLTTIFSEKCLGHLLKQSTVFSKNLFAVYRIYSLMKVCCVTFKDVPKKKPVEIYKQTIGACFYMNWMHF